MPCGHPASNYTRDRKQHLEGIAVPVKGLYIIRTKFVDSERLSVDNARAVYPGRTAHTGVGCAPNKPSSPSASRSRFGSSGAPDSHRTGLTDPPEDWPTVSDRDAAAVISREPQSHEARVWLVMVALWNRETI